MFYTNSTISTKPFRIIGIIISLFISSLILNPKCFSQGEPPVTSKKSVKKAGRIFYGQASYYAAKFHGRKTANGEIFNQHAMMAACNVLPLGTWVQVTNLKNGRIIVVKTSDRLHPKTRRILDLSKAAAQKLGYVNAGLTRVKIVVLDQKLYNKKKK